MSKQIISELKSMLKHTNAKVESLQKKLSDDFVYGLAWYGEDLWKQSFRSKELTKLVTDIENNLLDADSNLSTLDVLESWIDNIEVFLSRPYNVRENSTGSLHREVSTYRYQEIMEMMIEIKSIVKSAKKSK